MRKLFTYRGRREVAGDKRIFLPRIVDASEEIEGGGFSLDRVITQPTTQNRPQIQVLQVIRLEIAVDEAENPRAQIVIVANAALDRIGRRAGYRSRRIVAGVYGIGVQPKFVIESLALGGECQGEILGLTVTTCQGKTDVGATLPPFQYTGMQGFLVSAFLRFASYPHNRIFRRRHRTLRCGGDL